MKIGILTFHRANNIGAVLQASALQNYIENNISPCEIIDYVPNSEVRIHKKYRMLFHKLKLYLAFFKLKNSLIRENSFRKYHKMYIKKSKNIYFGDSSTKKLSTLYDCLISGSDQILNTNLSGRSTAYYLDFDSNAKKISYGSSFGREIISKEEEILIKKELSKFNSLSVREKSCSDIIYNILNIKPQIVVDPVFLLDKLEWTNRCNNNIKLPKHYIFVYGMENSELLESVVMKLCSENKIKSIVVYGGGDRGRILGDEFAACGPSEFLRLIKDAEVVITNSFHGCAFSIIFGKYFYCIPHSKRNTRIENLLQEIGQSNKIIYSSDNLKEHKINGEISYKKIKPLIYKSMLFLKKNLS